jgi:tRNA-splicing ligase RtcB
MDIKLQKIDQYRWQVPKEGPMRVPGLIFATEELMRDIHQDQSIQQVANVAHLPGILKHSIAMPDIHWGYGFPIGGVAAMDPDEGVLAPGGIGYDINCLSGDTKILHRWGYSRRLDEIVENHLREGIRCYDLKEVEQGSTRIIAGMRKKPSNSVLEVTTSTGRRIIATSDHPFFTPHGMWPLGKISNREKIAIDPFEGVPYENPGDEILVSEEDVREFLKRQGRTGGNAIPQATCFLKKHGLLPLRQNSAALPILIKIIGFVMGDGTIYFVNKIGKGMTWFFGQPEDLESIRDDVAQLGVTASILYRRDRQHRIETDYGDIRFASVNYSFKVGSRAFAALLALLGCPIGNKSIQSYGVPKWLKSAPLWQKRLFLASYFGAELQSPRAFPERNRNFPMPILTVQKNEKFAKDGRNFLNQIAEMVQEFGVETKGINEHHEEVFRKNGRSVRLRLLFSSRPESLLNLYARIGFEYHQKKRAGAAVVAAYQSYKRTIWKERQELLHEILRLRMTLGLTARKIASRLRGKPVNLRFIERTVYEGNRVVRVPEEFSSFDQFGKDATKGLEESGLVWEEIREVKPCTGVHRVYDITVDHPDHNFVANGFIVHNCGARLVRSDLEKKDWEPRKKEVMDALFQNIPSGVGSKGALKLSDSELKKVLTEGVKWAIQKGYATEADRDHMEESGCMPHADPEKVSARAMERGRPQLGTVGSGNHFVEVQYVDEIYDEPTASAFGLFKDQVTVMIHSGSRGLGYQVCDDYLKMISQACNRYGISVPDRQLCCVPLHSPEAHDYFGAMNCAINFAFTNRQIMTHGVRQTFEQIFRRSREDLGMTLVYDVCHNIAKFEEHVVDGKKRRVCVHRKGATRAFPPGHALVPKAYREVGQPVLIPGDMGRYSYVLVGTDKAMEETFGSSCHQAKKIAGGRDLFNEMEEKGILVRAPGRGTVAEEISEAYKDVADVVDVVHGAGIARKVARLRPLGVLKG